MSERYFTIPGNSYDPWDDEVHGREIPQPESIHEPEPEKFCEIGWSPGRYTYVAGSSGNEFVFQVPESPNELEPQRVMLQAIHAFLSEVGL